MLKLFQPARALALAVFLFILYEANSAPPLYDIEHSKYHAIRVDPDPKYRLSKDITPKAYTLDLRVVLNDGSIYQRFTAPGTVQIVVEVGKDIVDPPTSIRLHATTITLKEEEIKVTNGTDIPVTGITYDDDAQTFTIGLATGISPGEYTITIPFTAIIPDGRQTSFGLYRSSYVVNNVTRYYALTDFESVDARRMTPCFDEPAMKATWSISITRQIAYKSLSNTELLRTEPIDTDWERDVYRTTDPMSTYLVAVAVSDYSAEPAPAGFYNKPVTVWGPPPMMEAPSNGGKYSAELSAKVMQYFEDYLDVTYTFPKMDKFAVQDFSAGAMENWGLNTYRIIRLLYFEGESTIQDKVTMTNTIAHELAHQWFGNLVTMAWWDDIWLNEGFATYFATLAAEHVFPEYKWADYVVVDSVQYAMQADVRATTHPLHFDTLLQTPAETRYGFDTISYDKGCSILRMLQSFLTEPIFRAAMKTYLEDYRSRNAEQDQLFGSIQTHPGVQARLPNAQTNLKAVLDTWTLKSGFPVINVTRTSGTPNTITVSQSKYLNATENQKWFVPITYQTPTSYDPLKTEWLTVDAENLVVSITPAPADSDFVIINPEQTGYYRVMYDNASFDPILKQLTTDHTALNLKTRSALLDDTFNLGFAEYVPLENALELTKYLQNERELIPWATFVTNMVTPYRLLGKTGAFYYARKYLRNLFSTALTEIKIEPTASDPAHVMLLRNRLVEWSCNLGWTNCIDFAKGVVNTWIQDPTARPLTVQPDLRPYVYCTAVANADNKDAVYNFIFNRYKDSTTDADQLYLLRALACSQETSKLTGLVNNALAENSDIRDAHRLTAIQAVAGNSLGTGLVLDHLRYSTNSYIQRLGVTSIANVVATISNYVSSDVDIQDIRRFATANEQQFGAIAGSLESSLVIMENNKVWMSKHYAPMRTWFMNNSP